MNIIKRTSNLKHRPVGLISPFWFYIVKTNITNWPLSNKVPLVANLCRSVNIAQKVASDGVENTPSDATLWAIFTDLHGLLLMLFPFVIKPKSNDFLVSFSYSYIEKRNDGIYTDPHMNKTIRSFKVTLALLYSLSLNGTSLIYACCDKDWYNGPCISEWWFAVRNKNNASALIRHLDINDCNRTMFSQF